jgi:hypothetical protein
MNMNDPAINSFHPAVSAMALFPSNYIHDPPFPCLSYKLPRETMPHGEFKAQYIQLPRLFNYWETKLLYTSVIYLHCTKPSPRGFGSRLEQGKIPTITSKTDRETILRLINPGYHCNSTPNIAYPPCEVFPYSVEKLLVFPSIRLPLGTMRLVGIPSHESALRNPGPNRMEFPWGLHVGEADCK